MVYIRFLKNVFKSNVSGECDFFILEFKIRIREKCIGFLIEFQLKLYHAVIDDVIAGVRDSFLDEGVDEQVLQEMKHLWTSKLMASKAVEVNVEPMDAQQPAVLANNPPKSKVN